MTVATFTPPPSRNAGGRVVLRQGSMSPRQPIRQPWMIDDLCRGRALALSHSVDRSTRQVYSSALNLWLAFINMHHFPVEPTIDTLSYFIVYMSSHINPHSVKSYLSGLVQQLEPDFPSVWDIQSSHLISKVMRGSLKMNAFEIRRKKPLSIQDVSFITKRFTSSTSHNDLLFTALLVTGFHALLCLGELTFPDNVTIRDWQKVSCRATLCIRSHQYEFLLPAHKADHVFEGNRVLIQSFDQSVFDPLPPFLSYISS